MTNPQKRYPLVTALIETFGFSPALATVVALFVAFVAVLAVAWVVQSAPPRHLVLTSGPDGSSFQRWADSYQKILATHGVTLEVRPSAGSLENLQRLRAPGSQIDIAFLSGGLTEGVNLDGLESLGSIAYQPLWVFYRSPAPITRLAELAGKRIAVGGLGTGTHTLALTLLAANGITGAPTTFLERDSEVAASGLLDGRLDAVFLMGDSASLQTLRALVRSPEVRLFNFVQADAYVRRHAYLNRIELPEGSIDLGKNLPVQDTTLVGPTVELVARKGLNSALTDLLLEVAQEVHGKASILQKRGEFPAPQEHEIALSGDAVRFYKSGKGFLYSSIRSFWLANLLNRLLVVIVPVALVLIPAVRFLPVAYRWSVQLQIYRCYRPLLRLERDAAGPLTQDRVQELLARLDEIETIVDSLKVPASFADQFYVLRGHVAFVRQRLRSAAPVDSAGR
jgi:TRAP-type uncharacterized transport system substrate-binding protein